LVVLFVALAGRFPEILCAADAPAVLSQISQTPSIHSPTQQALAALMPPPRPSAPDEGGGETYVAAFVGVNRASGSDVRLSEAPIPGVSTLTPGTTESDPSLQTSIVYGAKVGHYFARWRWLGIEAEAYNTTPQGKEELRIRTEPGSPPAIVVGASSSMRVFALTWNVLARYPGDRFQPYVGAGIGLFFAHRSSAGDSHSSTQPGLNTELGLRYRATEHLGFFGEWKYNRTRFSFEETTLLYGRDLTYQAHMFVFGGYYAFN
jgi:opacity protein-like surface antigen